PADKQGQQAAGLWRGAEFAALAVGVVVWGLIVFVVVRYRRGRTSDTVVPSQRAEILPLEIAYTVTPLIIVAVLFGVTTLRQRKIQALSAHPDLTISATAYQWGWRFEY